MRFIPGPQNGAGMSQVTSTSSLRMQSSRHRLGQMLRMDSLSGKGTSNHTVCNSCFPHPSLNTSARGPQVIVNTEAALAGNKRANKIA